MSLKIREQNTWKGIVRESPGRIDEFTSLLEVNTEPGEDELRRIDGREPFLDSKLPAPSVKFTEPGSYLKYMYDEGAGPGTTHTFDFAVNIAFKLGNLDEAPTSGDVFLAGAIVDGDWVDTDTSYSWVLYFRKISDKWTLCAKCRGINATVAVDNSTGLQPNTWYWATFTTDVDTQSDLKLYDSSGSLIDSATDSHSSTSHTYSTGVYLGGNEYSYTDGFWGGEIAHFRLEGEYQSTPVPWVPDITIPVSFWSHFLPIDPTKTIFPAFDSTSYTGYVYYPRPGIETCSDSTIFNATGIKSKNGKGYNVSFSGKEIFKQRTVFMFYMKVTGEGNLLRSEDSIFRVSFNADLELSVFCFPKDTSSGQENFLNIQTVGNTGAIGTDPVWMAVEYIPDHEDGVDNIVFYKYNTGTDEWDQVGSQLQCQGILLPSLSQWVIGESFGGSCELYDFRAIVGDDEWSSKYTATQQKTKIPGSLVMWMNMDTSDRFTNTDRVDTYVLPNKTDYVDKIIGITDRVDGTIRYKSSPFTGRVSWGGCPYLSNSSSGEPHDFFINEDGEPEGTADCYWMQGTSSKPLYGVSVKGKRKAVPVGTHNYVTGAGPLQVTGRKERFMGKFTPFVYPQLSTKEEISSGSITATGSVTGQYAVIEDSAADFVSDQVTAGDLFVNDTHRESYIIYGVIDSTTLTLVSSRRSSLNGNNYTIKALVGSFADNTVDYEGHLEWETSYDFKATFYDPVTGSETPAHGPWTFTTGTTPSPMGTTSVEGCAFKIKMNILTSHSVLGEDVRFYRKIAGIYYLEGSASIVGWDTWLSNSFTASAEFTFFMSETELALNSQLSSLNADPPEHLGSEIWNDRAFYIDAFNPSRGRFSEYQDPGNVPLSNVFWTDEGTTGDILGFLPGFGGLLLLKERSIWIISPTANISQLVAQPLIPNIGAVSGSAAIFINNTLFWASPGGIYSYDGTTPVNHSERLGNLDTKVWAHDPKETRCWYDTRHWKIVFACEGAGISLDVRNGAAALIAAPETCCTEAVTSDYSGMLYGTRGAIWKESDSNHSLSLSSSGTHTSKALTKQEYSTDFSPIFLYWSDGNLTGSEQIGWTNDSTPSNYEWLGDNSENGRCAIFKETDNTLVFGAISAFYFGSNRLLFCSRPMATTEFWLDVTPMYYKSQYSYLGSRQSLKRIQKIDLLLGGSESNSGTMTFQYTAEVLGTGTVSATKPETASPLTCAANTSSALPVRLIGFRGYYTIISDAAYDLPPIRAIRTFYSISKAGGRKR